MSDKLEKIEKIADLIHIYDRLVNLLAIVFGGGIVWLFVHVKQFDTAADLALMVVSGLLALAGVNRTKA